MGYRISYEKGGIKREMPKKDNRLGKKRIIGISFVSFLIVGVILLQNAKIRHAILPGNGMVTETAIENFVESIQDGTRFGDAITAFCLEIIENAE